MAQRPFDRPQAHTDVALAAADVPVGFEQHSSVSQPDRSRIDFEIADIDERIGHQLDAILHRPDFQRLEAAWRGLKFLVDHTDFRKNVRIEVLDVDQETLRHDFEDAPDIVQSGLFRHTYTDEYDTPGGQPIGALISDYAFDAGAQDRPIA